MPTTPLVLLIYLHQILHTKINFSNCKNEYNDISTLCTQSGNGMALELYAFINAAVCFAYQFIYLYATLKFHLTK